MKERLIRCCASIGRFIRHVFPSWNDIVRKERYSDDIGDESRSPNYSR